MHLRSQLRRHRHRLSHRLVGLFNSKFWIDSISFLVRMMLECVTMRVNNALFKKKISFSLTYIAHVVEVEVLKRSSDMHEHRKKNRETRLHAQRRIATELQIYYKNKLTPSKGSYPILFVSRVWQGVP